MIFSKARLPGFPEPPQLLPAGVKQNLEFDQTDSVRGFPGWSMREVSVHERHVRAYRHELRTLTYVTFDDGKAGVIRNLNREGVAVQAVGALQPQQSVRLRFELKFPRLRVDTVGQVSWASPSGLCGIRFLDLPAHTGQQIDEWIFSSLLGATVRGAAHAHSMFGTPVISIAREENVPQENDGLTLSAAPRPAIRLAAGVTGPHEASVLRQYGGPAGDPYAQSNWLSRPISGRTLTWLVDGLVVTAALLMFALIFLSIAHELPPWPLTLGTAFAAAIVVAGAYWIVFAVFGGASLGARLARGVSSEEEEEEEEKESDDAAVIRQGRQFSEDKV